MSPIRFEWKHDSSMMFSATGKLEPRDLEEFRALLREHNDVTKVVIDMSGLDGFSPLTAARLLQIRPELGTEGKELVFHNPNEVIKGVLRLTGVDHVFPIIQGM